MDLDGFNRRVHKIAILWTEDVVPHNFGQFFHTNFILAMHGRAGGPKRVFI